MHASNQALGSNSKPTNVQECNNRALLAEAAAMARLQLLVGLLLACSFWGQQKHVQGLRFNVQKGIVVPHMEFQYRQVMACRSRSDAVPGRANYTDRLAVSANMRSQSLPGGEAVAFRPQGASMSRSASSTMHTQNLPPLCAGRVPAHARQPAHSHAGSTASLQVGQG